MCDAAVLVVEDEEPQLRLIVEILGRSGYRVDAAGSVTEALQHLETTVPDLVVCDWRMPGGTGGDLLREIRERALGCSFIVMTAYGSIAHAVEAVRMGADDYLAKPFEREALLMAVRRTLRTQRLERENRRLKNEVAEGDHFGDIIGRAPSMRRLYRTIEKVATTDATVLISGESGTGKELVARMLHQTSQRSAAPFVAVNCAAIPETLMESELFGHERGAFTGAHRRRPGRFEEADGGTLFLDEISSMPLPLQATVLRVLQERRFARLGGPGEIECDVRVVTASNRDLQQMVGEGRFRGDLYYRLNVVPIQLPPLRERREDIPLLVRVMLERACARHGIDLDAFSPGVLRCLMEYGWPGNVRELSNAIERLVLLAEGGKAELHDLPEEIRWPGGATATLFQLPAEGLQWDVMERSLLHQALESAAGNRAAAARLLGLGYKAFLYRLEKHDLA